jgi:NADPH-dependent glutamate synthase beta subunit-like oxidoreductase
MPLGYEITLFDEQGKGGGMMRSQIPSFRLPESVLDEEVEYIVDMGVDCRFGKRVESLKTVLNENFDAVFIGTGAPKGRDLYIPGREAADKHIHVGVDWLASVAFGHITSVAKRVIVLGGGNTAMDCCRTSRRMGGEAVKVVVRSPFADMKASPWEKEDAMHEGIPIIDNHVPKEFVVEGGKFIGVKFEKVTAVYDSNGKRSLVPTKEAPVLIECDQVLIAIGQDTAFPWIERDIGIEFNEWEMPIVDRDTFRTTNEKIFIGGDAAFGPDNIISSVAHGHQAAISIHLLCQEKDIAERPAPTVNLVSQKMGIHEWSFDNPVVDDKRYIVPLVETKKALSDRKIEVELGFDEATAFKEAQRCLNCDVQTVFFGERCIECDACMDICPTNCISFIDNGEEEELRTRLSAPAKNITQALYVSDDLKTGRIMVKDENVCLHCSLCAERCPTTAWDMQKFLFSVTQAEAV